MATVGPAYEVMGRIAYEFNRLQPFVPTYLHLIASAVFPIYAGAHASLSRPSSAAKAKSSARDDTDGDDGDEEDHEPRMEGLSPSDAIWLPLFAGMTLAGLYFLIKWLEDPALLNKLLNWYFSIFGILSVGKILADAMTLVTSYVFPKRWSSTSTIWHLDEKAQRFIRNRDVSPAPTAIERQRGSPLPGWMASMSLSSALTNTLWTLRRVLTQLCTLRVKVSGNNFLVTKFGFYDVVGIVIGAIAVAFYNFVSKPWWLTNLMGFGFAYGALQILSPTTFWTGTMILSSLFFYDIYFVFFT